MSKETNKKYKDKLKVLEEKVIYLYKHIEIKRNKYIIYNYSIDFINKEIKNPLSRENLGMYLFKYFYNYYEKRIRLKKNLKKY